MSIAAAGPASSPASAANMAFGCGERIIARDCGYAALEGSSSLRPDGVAPSNLGRRTHFVRVSVFPLRDRAAWTGRRRTGASQPRAASSFSFDRRPSTFALSVRSPAAAANSPARSGRPASAATSSRSWYGPRQHRRLRAFLPRGDRHRPDGRRRPRFPRGPPCRRGSLGRLSQYPNDFLPGDHQPRRLFLRPGQVPRKLLDPGAQPVRLGPGSLFLRA